MCHGPVCGGAPPPPVAPAVPPWPAVPVPPAPPLLPPIDDGAPAAPPVPEVPPEPKEPPVAAVPPVPMVPPAPVPPVPPIFPALPALPALPPVPREPPEARAPPPPSSLPPAPPPLAPARPPPAPARPGPDDPPTPVGSLVEEPHPPAPPHNRAREVSAISAKWSAFSLGRYRMVRAITSDKGDGRVKASAIRRTDGRLLNPSVRARSSGKRPHSWAGRAWSSIRRMDPNHAGVPSARYRSNRCRRYWSGTSWCRPGWSWRSRR